MQRINIASATDNRTVRHFVAPLLISLGLGGQDAPSQQSSNVSPIAQSPETLRPPATRYTRTRHETSKDTFARRRVGELGRLEIQTERQYKLIGAIRSMKEAADRRPELKRASLTELGERAIVEHERLLKVASETNVEFNQSTFLRYGKVLLKSSINSPRIKPPVAAALGELVGDAVDSFEDATRDEEADEIALVWRRMEAQEYLARDHFRGQDQNTQENWNEWTKAAQENPEFESALNDLLKRHLKIGRDPHTGAVTSPHDPMKELPIDVQEALNSGKVTPEQLQDLGRRALASVKGATANKKLQEEKPDSAAVKIAKIKESMVAADNAENSLNLAVQAMQIFGDKQTQIIASKLGQAGSAALDAYRALRRADVDPANFGGMILTGDLLGAGLKLFGAILGGGPSTEEMILEEVRELRKEVAEMREEIRRSFEHVDAKLTHLQGTIDDRFAQVELVLSDQTLRLDEIQATARVNYIELQRLQRRFCFIGRDIHEDITELERSQFELMDAMGARFSARTLMKMPEMQFHLSLAGYAQRGTSGSKGSLHVNGASARAYTWEEAYERLSADAPQRQIDYIIGYSEHLNGSAPTGLDLALCDPLILRLCAERYLTLLKEYPEYARELTTADLDRFLEEGLRIRDASFNLGYFHDEHDQLVVRSDHLNSLLDSYRETGSELTESIESVYNGVETRLLGGVTVEPHPETIKAIDRSGLALPSNVTHAEFELPLPPAVRMILPSEIFELDTILRARNGGKGLSLRAVITINESKLVSERQREFAINYDQTGPSVSPFGNFPRSSTVARRGFIERECFLAPIIELSVVDAHFGELASYQVSLPMELSERSYWPAGNRRKLDDLTYSVITPDRISQNNIRELIMSKLPNVEIDFTRAITDRIISNPREIKIASSTEYVKNYWSKLLQANVSEWRPNGPSLNGIPRNEGMNNLREQLEIERLNTAYLRDREIHDLLDEVSHSNSFRQFALTPQEVERVRVSLDRLSGVREMLYASMEVAYGDAVRTDSHLVSIFYGDRALPCRATIDSLLLNYREALKEHLKLSDDERALENMPRLSDWIKSEIEERIAEAECQLFQFLQTRQEQLDDGVIYGVDNNLYDLIENLKDARNNLPSVPLQ